MSSGPTQATLLVPVSNKQKPNKGRTWYLTTQLGNIYVCSTGIFYLLHTVPLWCLRHEAHLYSGGTVLTGVCPPLSSVLWLEELKPLLLFVFFIFSKPFVFIQCKHPHKASVVCELL